MNKEDLISLIKRKIEEHKKSSDNVKGNDLTAEALRSFEYGCARGLEEALGFIGMLDKPNKIRNECGRK